MLCNYINLMSSPRDIILMLRWKSLTVFLNADIENEPLCSLLFGLNASVCKSTLKIVEMLASERSKFCTHQTYAYISVFMLITVM
jgi:hypothetical protein